MIPPKKDHTNTEGGTEGAVPDSEKSSSSWGAGKIVAVIFLLLIIIVSAAVLLFMRYRKMKAG
jgi:hypothetical protein